jgi:hypothetical protein
VLDSVGVSPEPVGPLEEMNLVAAAQQPRRGEARDTATDDRNPHVLPPSPKNPRPLHSTGPVLSESDMALDQLAAGAGAFRSFDF